MALLVSAMSMISLISSASASSIVLMSPSTPKASTIDGLPANEGMAGQQLVITTTVQNNLNEARSYASIIEIRNSEGLTLVAGWQTGEMDAHGSAVIGISWTPQKADTYEMRTFVVSGMDNPQAYSNIESSKIKIGER